MSYTVRFYLIDALDVEYTDCAEPPALEGGRYTVKSDDGDINIFNERHVVRIECEKEPVKGLPPPPPIKPSIELHKEGHLPDASWWRFWR